MKYKILLADDEKDIVEFLKYNLEEEGFNVITAYDGKEALEKLSQKPDLILLDIMMPRMDGYEVCSKIRAMNEFNNVPIIFLTAKVAEIDEVHGLNIGANDFIKKPISPKTLIARLKANLRKKESESPEPEVISISIGPLEINREKYTVELNGKSIVLPKKEFEILSFLSSNPGKVFPREKILGEIWGDDIFVVERTIDVHVRKIREKLGKYSDLIETIKGVGYRFKDV
ncbi:MAG: response regulator transcription factor [Melioribacteraceae bacterium]|jgi:two-component system alkaline phosphatase synthesis response regulator PhoP|nr:response regulator transcription factor [Melioribacteraceae bacterium]